uniref:Uncharacterized protein n=1 Tax=Paraburkholderia sprentiae WSM5005 TaxID=754502 RepID=A0A1I9YQA6_9BURK
MLLAFRDAARWLMSEWAWHQNSARLPLSRFVCTAQKETFRVLRFSFRLDYDRRIGATGTRSNTI